MHLFALPDSQAHGGRIASAMVVTLSELEFRGFSEGECKIRPLCEVASEQVCIVQSLYDGPDHNDRGGRVCKDFAQRCDLTGQPVRTAQTAFGHVKIA